MTHYSVRIMLFLLGTYFIWAASSFQHSLEAEYPEFKLQNMNANYTSQFISKAEAIEDHY